MSVKTVNMFKRAALILVLGTIFNFVLTVHQENGNNDYSDYEVDVTPTSEEYSLLSTKYPREKGKENFYPEKELHNKQDRHHKIKEHQNGCDEHQPKGKHVKPSKLVSFNQKNGLQDNKYNHIAPDTRGSSRDTPKESSEEYFVTISLDHDTDVNYINTTETTDPDVEILFPDEKFMKKSSIIENCNVCDWYITVKEGEDIKTQNESQVDRKPLLSSTVLVARYIMHHVDWTALATLSTKKGIKGAPFVNVISVSDGPKSKGLGVPYFYMTPKDFSFMDLEKDSRCCITVTLAQTNFCRHKNLDPQSPLCAKLILCGKMKKVKPGVEEQFARVALFSRHPDMKRWPADHDWFFTKMKIKQIMLINHFGGASYISIQDYLKANSA